MLRNRGIITKQAKQCAMQLIKECLKCYLEVTNDLYGRPIIGYHHILTSKEIQETFTITQQQADKFLATDLESMVYRQAESYWGVHLGHMNQWRVAALLDATYSCGNLRWPKLTQAVFRNNWEDAAEELMDSRYAHQVGPRAMRNACILRDGKRYTLTGPEKQNWDLDEEDDQ